MKIHIEIITGFLGAGKTTFINSILSETQVDEENICVFQFEQGKEEIKQISNLLVKTKELSEVKELKEEMIFSINEDKPYRIIIEYNGTYDLNELFNIINEKIYRDICKVTKIFFVADGNTLNEYIDNIGGFIIPFIQCADIMIVNNIDICDKKVLEKTLKKLKNINSKAHILKVKNKYALKSALREGKVLENKYLKKLKIKFTKYKKQ